MENSDGVVCSDEDEITNILVHYYQSLFTSATPHHLEEALAAIPEVITEEMNSMLTAEYSLDEVDEALKHMEPLKALGPDDLPPLFFKNSGRI